MEKSISSGYPEAGFNHTRKGVRSCDIIPSATSWVVAILPLDLLSQAGTSPACESDRLQLLRTLLD